MSVQDYEDGLKEAYEQPGAIAAYEAEIPETLPPAPTLSERHATYLATREEFADVDERYTDAKNLFDEVMARTRIEWEKANAELIKEYTDTRIRSASAEGELRTAIVEAYNANPSNKIVAPGLSVQVRSKLSYDEQKAIGWAFANAPICVVKSLDKKAFEAICKTNKPDFVEVVETVIAVIK